MANLYFQSLVGGRCERCGSHVETRYSTGWYVAGRWRTGDHFCERCFLRSNPYNGTNDKLGLWMRYFDAWAIRAGSTLPAWLLFCLPGTRVEEHEDAVKAALDVTLQELEERGIDQSYKMPWTSLTDNGWHGKRGNPDREQMGDKSLFREVSRPDPEGIQACWTWYSYSKPILCYYDGAWFVTKDPLSVTSRRHLSLALKDAGYPQDMMPLLAPGRL